MAAPVYYPSPNVSRPASQLTEEEQVSEFDIIQLYNVASTRRIMRQCFSHAISGSRMSLSYREFIECRYIGLFRISKSISYQTSHIKYLDMPLDMLLICLFPLKILENPKILRKFRKFSGNSENSPEIQKIRRNF